MVWEILDLMTLTNGDPPIHQNPAQLCRIKAVLKIKHPVAFGFPVFMVKYKSLNGQE